MPIEPLTAAAGAVALLAPYLVKAGEEAAGKIGEASAEAAGKVLTWMRTRLTGRAKEALVDLEKAPEAEDNQADLRKQLTKILQSEPKFLAELLAMLPPETFESPGMEQNVSGSGARAAQVRGSGNTTSVG
jgi:hypothetical protein